MAVEQLLLPSPSPPPPPSSLPPSFPLSPSLSPLSPSFPPPLPPPSSESLLEPAAENLAEKYARFFQQSGLFVERLAEEKERYQAVSEARLKELAAKLGAAGPLSEVIIAERDRN